MLLTLRRLLLIHWNRPQMRRRKFTRVVNVRYNNISNATEQKRGKWFSFVCSSSEESSIAIAERIDFQSRTKWFRAKSHSQHIHENDRFEKSNVQRTSLAERRCLDGRWCHVEFNIFASRRSECTQCSIWWFSYASCAWNQLDSCLQFQVRLFTSSECINEMSSIFQQISTEIGTYFKHKFPSPSSRFVVDSNGSSCDLHRRQLHGNRRGDGNVRCGHRRTQYDERILLYLLNGRKGTTNRTSNLSRSNVVFRWTPEIQCSNGTGWKSSWNPFSNIAVVTE